MKTSIEFIFDGKPFIFDGWFLKAMPPIFHPTFVLYARVRHPDDPFWPKHEYPLNASDQNYVESRLVAAALTIIKNKEQWIKECEDRKGMPEGYKIVDDDVEDDGADPAMPQPS